ncbi:hypothetical protein LINGRAHAP2_LOCUS15629 [Linum grandiflorum]
MTLRLGLKQKKCLANISSIVGAYFHGWSFIVLVQFVGFSFLQRSPRLIPRCPVQAPQRHQPKKRTTTRVVVGTKMQKAKEEETEVVEGFLCRGRSVAYSRLQTRAILLRLQPTAMVGQLLKRMTTELGFIFQYRTGMLEVYICIKFGMLLVEQ